MYASLPLQPKSREFFAHDPCSPPASWSWLMLSKRILYEFIHEFLFGRRPRRPHPTPTSPPSPPSPHTPPSPHSPNSPLSADAHTPRWRRLLQPLVDRRTD